MELVRANAVESVNLTETAPKESSSYFESLKSRLSRLPRVPSSIIVPATASSPISEPAESVVTSIAERVSSETPTSGSTAAASVPELPLIFSIQKLYVSPSMEIDEELQAIWIKQIKPRLSLVLLQHIPTGTCVQEFMMAGRRPSTLKPSLIITCGDRITKKRVEKAFKSQSWLQDLLKSSGITFIALIGTTSLSARLIAEPSEWLVLHGAYKLQAQRQNEIIDKQAVIAVHTSKLCTLGGLLMVNGNIMGLTAGHPFRTQDVNVASSDVVPSGTTADDEDLDGNDSSSSSSDEPFVFNEDEEGNSGTTSESSVSLPDNSLVQGLSDNSNKYYSSNWFVPKLAHVYLPRLQSTPSAENANMSFDWALLSSVPADRNLILNRTHDNILVRDFMTQPVAGEVNILHTSIGPRLGYLQPSAVTLQVDRNVQNVQLITLERSLREFSQLRSDLYAKVCI